MPTTTATSKIVIVGECPSKTNDGSAAGKRGPLDGPSGQRLADLCGISLDEFLDLFDRWNLFTTHVPYKDWDRSDAIDSACDLMRDNELRGRKIVMLGRRVEKAFLPDWKPAQFFTWDTRPGRGYGNKLCVVPHPSGLNRWWNDANNAEDARLFWKVTVANAREANNGLC